MKLARLGACRMSKPSRTCLFMMEINPSKNFMEVPALLQNWMSSTMARSFVEEALQIERSNTERRTDGLVKTDSCQSNNRNEDKARRNAKGPEREPFYLNQDG